MKRIILLTSHLLLIGLVACAPSDEDKVKQLQGDKEQLAQENARLKDEAQAAVPVDEQLLITSKSVGGIQMGEDIRMLTVPAPLRLKQTIVRMNSEEGPYDATVWLVSDRKEELMQLSTTYQQDERYAAMDTVEIINTGYQNQSKEAVSDIEIFSDRYQSAGRIHVGSSFGEFIKAYPDYQVWYTYVSDRYVLETAQLPNVQFKLDPAGFTASGKKLGKSEIDQLTAQDFKMTTAIQSIRLFQ